MGWEKKAAHYAKQAEGVLNTKWFALALVLFIVLISFSLRATPATLPITEDWASQTLQNNYVSQAEAQIRQEFPNLPAQQVRQEALKEYQTFAAANHDELAAQQAQLSEQFRQRLQLAVEKPDGVTYQQTYLTGIDSYYYLRRGENVAETGTACDEVRDGRCWDTYTTAPKGTPASNDGHSYVEGWLITLFGLFGFSSLTAAFYMPAIFGALFGVPLFFLVRKKYGSFAGLVAGLVVSLQANLLSRTMGGFADTDVWTVFFPVFIIWLVFLAFERKDVWRYAYSFAAAILSIVYAQFWIGWWYTGVIVLATFLAVALFHAARWALSQRRKHLSKEHRVELLNEAKASAIHFGIYLVSIVVLLWITAGAHAVRQFFLAPIDNLTRLQAVTGSDIWPNVLRTVAELNPGSIAATINAMGGRLVFILAVIGIFVFVLRSKKPQNEDWGILGGVIAYYFLLTTQQALALGTFTYLFLFTVPFLAVFVYGLFIEKTLDVHYGILTTGWFVVSLFAVTQGVRFNILLVPIFALTLGFCAGYFMLLAKNYLSKLWSIPELAAKTIVVVVFSVLLFTPIAIGANYYGKAVSVADTHVPSMNDAWWNVLTDIKEDSQPDAIITSWWDFGHWFKYVADRGATFDGARQNSPPAHWVGNLFLQDDPVVAAGTLRMLNCGWNDGFETLDQAFADDSLRAYNVIEQIRSLSTVDAREVLASEGLSEDVIEQTLDATHCENPPESYVIVSEDMIGKAAVWGHFGGWDFTRSYIKNIVLSQPREQAVAHLIDRFNYSQAEATQMYTSIQSMSDQEVAAWVSSWPQYAGTSSCTRGNQTSTCRIGLQLGQQQGIPLVADRLIINHTNVSESFINVIAQGQTFPIKPSYLRIDGEEYNLGGDFTIDLTVQGNTITIADRRLATSVFTQLFINEDGGELFEEVTRGQQVTGGKIIVYKVNWDAYFAQRA